MYFIPETLMHPIQDALRDVRPIPDAAIGRYTHQGVAGYVVNADAINMDDMARLANRVAGMPDGSAEFDYSTTNEGLCIISLRVEPLEELADNTTNAGNGGHEGSQRDERHGDGDIAPDPVLGSSLVTSPQRIDRPQPSSLPQFVPLVEWHPLGWNLRNFKSMLLADQEHNNSNISKNLRILIQNVHDIEYAKYGVPDLEDNKDDVLVLILALPGARSKRRKKLTTFCIEQAGRREVEIPVCALPDGMTAISMSGVQVACYDERRLFIHTANPSLVVHILSLFVDRLKSERKRYPSDTEHTDMALHLAGAMMKAEQRDLEQTRSIAAQLVSIRKEMKSCNQEIDMLTYALENAAEEIDPENIKLSIHNIRQSSDWSVYAEDARIKFRLKNTIVVDPRNRRSKIMPKISLSLEAMLDGAPPFVIDPNTRPTCDHPRIFAGDFISDEASDAFRETAKSGDIEGALSLAHDILTNFAADDPDVSCLDRWNDA